MPEPQTALIDHTAPCRLHDSLQKQNLINIHEERLTIMIQIAERLKCTINPDSIGLKKKNGTGDRPARAQSKTRAGTRKSSDGAWINGKL